MSDKLFSVMPMILNPDEEEPITLSGRRLIIPASLKTIGVTMDDNSEIVTFQFPKTYDGVNLDDKMIHVDFINAGGESDSYLITDQHIKNDSLIFTCPITDKFTRYKGKSKFAVRITGNDYRFGTEIASVNIANGLDVSGEIAESVPNLFEQWEIRINELYNNVIDVKDDVQKLQSDYTSVVQAGTNEINQSISRLDSLNTAVTTNLNRVEKTENSVNVLYDNVVDMKSDVQSLQSQYSSVIESGTNEINQSISRLDSLNTAVTTNLNRVEKTENSVNELYNNVTDVKADVQKLQTQYTSVVQSGTNEINASVNRLNSLNTAVTTNLNRLENMQVPLTETEWFHGKRVFGEYYKGITSNKGVRIRSIEGASYQETTKGYQLFDIGLLNKKGTGNGISWEIDDNGWITTSGNIENNNNVSYITITNSNANEDLIKLVLNALKPGKIKVKTYGDESCNPCLFLQLITERDGKVVYLQTNSLSMSSINITESDIQNVTLIQMQIGFYANRPVKTGRFKFMVYQDGDGTWEPFTGCKPAPSVDYPMPVKFFNPTAWVSQGASHNLADFRGLNFDTNLFNINYMGKFVSMKKEGIGGVIYNIDKKYTEGMYNAPIKVYNKDNKDPYYYFTYYLNGKSYEATSKLGQQINNNNEMFISDSCAVGFYCSSGDRNAVYQNLRELNIFNGDPQNVFYEKPNFMDRDETYETIVLRAVGDIKDYYVDGKIQRNVGVAKLSGKDNYIFSIEDGRQYLYMVLPKNCQNIPNNRIRCLCNISNVNADFRYPNSCYVYSGRLYIVFEPNQFKDHQDLTNYINNHDVYIYYPLDKTYVEDVGEITVPSYEPRTLVYPKDTEVETTIEFEPLPES